MHAAVARRVDELVECGWEPQTTTETSAALVGRRPFSWWLFLLVVVFFPLFGGTKGLGVRGPRRLLWSGGFRALCHSGYNSGL